MMCPEMEVRLNEYLDGTLAPRDRAAIEEHLAGCTGCRAALAELRGVVAGARDLPRSIVPRRDVWAGVAARIKEGREARRWWRERTFWAGALATAATLAIGFVIYRLTAIPPFRSGAGGGAREGEPSWAAVQADYDHAAAELSSLLALQRGRLAPATVALVDRNLGIIDAAIRESRAALARDPGSVAVQGLYAAAARQKVELLRWAVRAAAAS